MQVTTHNTYTNFQNGCPTKPSNLRKPRDTSSCSQANKKVQFTFKRMVGKPSHSSTSKPSVDELLKMQKEEIDVSFRDDLSESELNSLKTAVGLKRLRCRDCKNLTNDVVFGYTRLSDLESLDLSMNATLNDSMFSQFSFKSLKELNLSDTKISGKGLKTLNSKTIQTLILRKCPDVTIASLQHVVLQLPALQKLDITDWDKGAEGEKYVKTLEQFCIIKGRKIKIDSDYAIDTYPLLKQVERWKLFDDEKTPTT